MTFPANDFLVRVVTPDSPTPRQSVEADLEDNTYGYGHR